MGSSVFDDSSGLGRVSSPPSDPLGEAAMMQRVASRLFEESPAAVTIGRFVVESHLGAGGMGVVMSAHDPKLGRKVAMKLLRTHLDRDETLTRRLEQEASALARLSHPNVVQVYEVGEHEGQVFLAMELVDGSSLRDWLSEEPRSWREILDKYLQAGAGLAAAHRVGIIHRDFKPANVLVGKDGRVRVADFGLAREASSEGSGGDIKGSPSTTLSASGLQALTRSGIVGTPAYMSPEQLAGYELDARSDQFSFCVALWEALAGHRPYRPEMLRRVASGSSTEPARPRGGLAGPRWVGVVLRRGLALDPAQRFPTMEALLGALVRAPVRRRRILASLGGVGLGLSALVWRQQAGEPCPSAAADLVGIWDDDRRTRVAAIVAASNLSFVPTTWRAAEARLDAYAEAWIEARRSACVATRVEGRQSEAQLDLSVECLDRRALGLEAAVDLLAEGGVEAIVAADELVAALDPVDPCLRTQHLRRDDGRPTALPSTAEALNVDLGLAAARSLLAARRPRDAHQTIGEAIVGARDLGDASRLAEGLYVQGQAEVMLGEGAAATASFTEAASAAMEVDDDELAARSWLGLVPVGTFELEDLPRTREWLLYAERIVQGHEVDERVHRELGVAQADLAVLEGRPMDALGILTELREGTKRGDPQDVVIASRMAKVLGELGRLDESDELYAEVITLLNVRLGAGHPSTADYCINLAINELERPEPDFARARQLLEDARALYQDVYGAHDRRLGGVLTSLGQIAWATGDMDGAEALARAAVEVLRRHLRRGHSERAGAVAMLANVLIERGRYREGVELHRDMIEEYLAGGNRQGARTARQILAWLLCRVERCEGAQAQIDAARDGLAPDDGLHVLLDAVEGAVRLEQGDADGAVRILRSVEARVDGLDVDAHAFLRPELAAELARASFAQGADWTHVCALVDEARAGYLALGRAWDVEALDAWSRSAGSGGRAAPCQGVGGEDDVGTE